MIENKVLIQKYSIMTNWIFPYNKNKFKLEEILNERDSIEWGQRKYKLQPGDIVYLYCSAPEKRITHKMIVVETDIPEDKTNDDDGEFKTKLFDKKYKNEEVYFRMKYVKNSSSPMLCLNFLRQHGLNSCMQGATKATGILLDYIEQKFK